MKTLRLLPFLAIAGCTLATRPLLAAGETDAQNGRALVKRYADTVVSIEMVITIRATVGDHAIPPRENKVDVNGTVVSPTGLTVTCLSTIDPRGAMEAMRNSQGGGQKVEFGETEFKDVKLRLANGSEVPAVIVLKDPDLNLAFIAPLVDKGAPTRVFPFVSLDSSAKPEILGDYYIVWRASKNLQRVPLVRMSTLAGIVQKPRTMYLLSDQVVSVPIFDKSGGMLGLSTLSLDNGKPTGLVALTSDDVAELAKQATAIKPEEKAEDSEKTAPAETPPQPSTLPSAVKPSSP